MKHYLPHHRCPAYLLALELLAAVREARITDLELRDQGLRAAKSACLNIAEASGRGSHADKARVYMIARGETSEARAAVEVAVQSGEARASALPRVTELGGRRVERRHSGHAWPQCGCAPFSAPRAGKRAQVKQECFDRKHGPAT